MTEPAEWTFMVYMAGDNNLSAAGDLDLAEMRQVGSNDKLNVVVEFDNAGDDGTRRIRIEPNGDDETVEQLGETDSGSPQVLYDFIGWVADNYPAKRYALILWNHGSGWAPSEVDRIARAVRSPGYSEREIAERSSSALGRAFFRSTLERVLALNSPAQRAICSDDGTAHSLDTLELQRVLARSAERLGQPFDLLGMDACLMSNLEVAYEVREHVRYIVASEENEPAEGWPYDRILRRLSTDPGMGPATLARHIVEDYVDSYVERGFRGNVTQAAIDVSRLASLTQPLDALAGQLIANMADAYRSMWRAQRSAARFWHNTLWDVGQFCSELGTGSDHAGIAEAAAAVVDAHAVGNGQALVAESHSGTKVASCHGTTVYLVPPVLDISSFYPELAFARDFEWLEMLRAYHAA